MAKLFVDLKVTDGRRIDATKNVLMDYLLGEKQLLQTQLKVGLYTAIEHVKIYA